MEFCFEYGIFTFANVYLQARSPQFGPLQNIVDLSIDQAVLYKEHAAKAGINIDVIKKPADGYWEVVWLKEPWVMCDWNGRTTVDWMFSTAYSGDAKWNDTHFKHEHFDKLLKEARAELDEKKRAEMYFETQKI